MEKTCKHCGTPLPDGANYCPECGAKRQTLCTSCGKAVDGMKFCMHCGTKVEPAPAEVTAPAEEEVAVPSTPIPQTAPCDPQRAPDPVKKSRKGLVAAATVLCVAVLVSAVYTLRQPAEDVADAAHGETQQTQQQTSLPQNPPADTDDPQDVPAPPQQTDTPAADIVDHMTLQQVFETLDGVWYTGEFTRDGMMYIWVRTEEGTQVFETGILSSEQNRKGTVSGFRALGGNRYDVTVTFPAVEETVYAAAMEEKTATVTLDLSALQEGTLTVTGDPYAKESPAQYAYAAANMEAALYLIYG